MEEVTLLLNSTDVNDSILLLGEFPYWKPTLAVSLVGDTLVFWVVIILYLLVLVALIKLKKERLRPVNIVHETLLGSAIVEDMLRLIIDILYLPSVFRNCFCPVVIGTIYFVVLLGFNVYRIFGFASLGVLQFLVVSGKKKLVNLKVAFGAIGLCIGISLIFIAIAVRWIHISDEKLFCYESYCPGYRSESGFGEIIVIFVLVILVCFLPSLVIVIVTSTWSCAVFKKYYIGGDDQLNRRILSLPVVMPLVILASTVIESVVILLATEIFLVLSLGIYFPYWIAVAQAQIGTIFRIISRPVYPFVLIYTHSHVREAVKSLLKRFKGRANQIVPV